jgi:hypothetical protein
VDRPETGLFAILPSRSFGMRTESDVQGNFRSEAPACHRCGLPLLAEAQFCPYCERWLDESAVARVLGRRRAAGASPRRIVGISERLLLSIGAVVFTLAAIASIVVALVA